MPSYFEADVRLGWRVTPQLELSLAGLNLVHARHAEATPAADPGNSAQRLPRRPVEFLNVREGALASIARRIGLVAWAARCWCSALRSRWRKRLGIEHAVKATYLYKFAPFVEWPAGAFRFPSDPLVICIVGTDAVGSLVDEAATGQTVARPARSAVVHLQRRRAYPIVISCMSAFVA